MWIHQRILWFHSKHSLLIHKNTIQFCITKRWNNPIHMTPPWLQCDSNRPAEIFRTKDELVSSRNCHGIFNSTTLHRIRDACYEPLPYQFSNANRRIDVLYVLSGRRSLEVIYALRWLEVPCMRSGLRIIMLFFLKLSGVKWLFKYQRGSSNNKIFV